MTRRVLMTLGILLVAAAPSYAEFIPITPCRLLDTRVDDGGLPLTAGLNWFRAARGKCGIPPTATAINYNATVVSAGGPGFLTLFPSDEPRPVTSSLNFKAADVNGNAGVVGLGNAPLGLGIYFATAPQGLTAHLVIDVTGFHAGSLMAVAARASGERFTANRWEDLFDGTAIDRLTGLQWELKSDDNSIHDRDNVYTWSAGGGAINESGTAYTIFLPGLNTPPCFAGHCDWRLPTIDELQAISEQDLSGCVGTPCTFMPGNAAATGYWSSTTSTATNTSAWTVSFNDGLTQPVAKSSAVPVLAVRGRPGGPT